MPIKIKAAIFRKILIKLTYYSERLYYYVRNKYNPF